MAEERARYARQPDLGAGLRADVLTVRRALAASADGRRRLRARLLPASAFAAASRGIAACAASPAGNADPGVRTDLRSKTRQQ